MPIDSQGLTRRASCGEGAADGGLHRAGVCDGQRTEHSALQQRYGDLAIPLSLGGCFTGRCGRVEVGGRAYWYRDDRGAVLVRVMCDWSMLALWRKYYRHRSSYNR